MSGERETALDFNFIPTQRGFARANFKDLYGEQCSIQASSIASCDAIWLGCDHETLDPKSAAPCGARMHLSRSQVASLLPILQRFVETGELAVPETQS